MNFPWKDLGLFQAWIDGSNECVLYDFENDEPLSKTSARQGLLRITYSEGDSVKAHEGIFDLRVLARALLPTHSEHRLEAIRDHYELPKGASETKTLVRLLQALLNEVLSLDRELVALLAQLLPSPISDVLTQVL
ncbi:MAG: hypothetical protein V3T03_00040, partial [Candidatus Bipolaricaulota bacterium]